MGKLTCSFARIWVLSQIPGHKFQGAVWGKKERKKGIIFNPCPQAQWDDVQKYHLLLQRQRQCKHLISSNLLGGCLLELYSVWISWNSGVPHFLWNGCSEVHISPVFLECYWSCSACASGVSRLGCLKGQAEEIVSEMSLKEVISGLCFIQSIIYSVYLCSLPSLLLSELSQQHRYGLWTASPGVSEHLLQKEEACRPPEKLYFPSYGPVHGIMMLLKAFRKPVPPSMALHFLDPGAHCAPVLPLVLGRIRDAGFFSTYTALLGKLPSVSITSWFSPLWLQQPGVSRLH